MSSPPTTVSINKYINTKEYIMPWHVSAYSANTFGVTSFDSAALTDGIMTISNGHFLPNTPMQLYGGWFGGANLTRVVLQTPKTRQVVPPVLLPIQASLLPPDRPHFFDRRRQPLTLNAVEEVQILMNIGGAANAFNYGILFWGPSMEAAPSGDIYTLHGVSTTPVTANAWSQVQVTWDQNLPAGTYAVVGSQVQSTNAIAHRFTFKDQVWRPGFLSVTSVTNITEGSYYSGGWGLLGKFNTYTMPIIEVLANAADAAHDICLNIVRTA
jgi:hypothetical protein